jgi:SHS2 domain-containing protein
MFDMMVEAKRALIPSIEVPVAVEAPTLDELMVRWLAELLYVFETRRLVLTNFWIDEIGGGRLAGSAKGLKFDSARHAQKLAIKAVTYHRIRVERSGGGWVAEVIFDI